MEFVDQLRNLHEQILFKGDLHVDTAFKNIVISGMGGSGIVGNIFSEIYSRKPVHVVSDYVLPEFADKDTLFIGISYSGNTEETIAALEEAEKRGCQVRLITSGGKLAASGHTLVRIPQNIQPRSAIGYMLKPLLSSFLKLPEETYLGISKLLEDIDGDNTEEKNLAMEIFKHRSIPVILGYHPFRWAAYRWKTQFNENSKIMAFSNYFPELNHNETMPLKDTYEKDKFMFLAFDGSQNSRISKRMNVTAEITGTKFHVIKIKGSNLLEQLFYLIHYGDYVSYHLAGLRGIDPNDVSLIESLKKKI